MGHFHCQYLILFFIVIIRYRFEYHICYPIPLSFLWVLYVGFLRNMPKSFLLVQLDAVWVLHVEYKVPGCRF